MSEARHTPGPWDFAWEDGKHGVIAPKIGGKMVAIIANNTPDDDYEKTRKANGRLMSASPEMLKVLKSLNVRWSKDFEGPENMRAVERFTKGQIREWKNIRAVIAKADGRS